LVIGTYFGTLYGLDLRKTNQPFKEFEGNDSRVYSIDFERRADSRKSSFRNSLTKAK